MMRDPTVVLSSKKDASQWSHAFILYPVRVEIQVLALPVVRKRTNPAGIELPCQSFSQDTLGI